jgi:membrane associated rhomboid family serine protease
MGLYDRDYYREDSSTWWGSPSERRGVTFLIALTVVGMISYHIILTPIPNERGSLSVLDSYTPFHTPSVLKGEVWRFLTSFFVTPFSFFGIVLGLIGLYSFGGEMETIYGTRRFVLFYVVAGLLGNLAKFGLSQTGQALDAHTSGASAPIFATFVLFAFHYPQRPISFLITSIPIWIVVVVYLALNLLMFFNTADSGYSKIAVADPLVGAIFGFVFYQSRGAMLDLPALESRRGEPRPLRLVTTKDEPESVTVSAPKRTAAPAMDEHLEAKLDDVLAKVAKHGKASLTSDEQALLLQASEMFKKRRQG